MMTLKEIIKDSVTKLKKISLTDIQKLLKENENNLSDIYIKTDKPNEIYFKIDNIEFLIKEKIIQSKNYITINYIYLGNIKHISKLKQTSPGKFVFDIKNFKTDKKVKYTLQIENQKIKIKEN